MIIVNIQGGLGNQLQQYALYRKFISLGREARLDVSWFLSEKQTDMAAKRDLELDYFRGISYIPCTEDEKRRLTGGPGFAGKVRRKLTSLTGMKFSRIYTEDGIFRGSSS